MKTGRDEGEGGKKWQDGRKEREDFFFQLKVDKCVD